MVFQSSDIELDRVTTQLKENIQKHSKLRILEEIRSFDGIDSITLWKDVQFSLFHVNDFTHAAVMADAKWMRTYAEAMDSILSAKVQAFKLAKIDRA